MTKIKYSHFILCGLLMISCCSISRKLLYFPQPLSNERLIHVKQNYPHVEEVCIPIDNKINLHGWFINKNLDTMPTLIYFGGNSEEVTYQISDFDQQIHANILLINYRGYGLSAGAPSESVLKSDALAIYEFLLSTYNMDKDQIISVGRSLGSGIACYLAVEKELKKTILITPYDSIENVAKNSYPSFFVNLFLIDKYKTLDLCDQLKSETLIIATQKDEIISFKNTQNLYEHIQSEKTLVSIDEAMHNTIFGFQESMEAINQFIALSE